MAQKKSTKTPKTKSTNTNKAQANILAKEILGILIILFAMLSFVFIFITTKSGTFAKPFRSFVAGIFGWAHYLLPLVIILFGAKVAIAGRVKILSRKTLYLMLLLLMVPFFFQIVYLSNNMGDIAGLNVWKFIEYMYIIGKDNLHNGGVFGGIFITPLVIFFGITGSYIIAITASLVLLIYITNQNFLDFLRKLGRMFAKLFIWIKDAFKPIDNDSLVLQEEDQVEDRIRTSRTDRVVRGQVENEPPNIIINEVKKRPRSMPKDVEEKAFVQEEIVRPIPTPIPIAKKKQEEIKDIDESKTVIVKSTSGKYTFPPLSLLDSYLDNSGGDNYEEIAQKLEETLYSFGVEVSVTNIMSGPTVTRYELQPKSGVKVSRIVSLADDISLNLASRDVRIEAPVPGKSVVGIEVPNTKKNIVSLKEVIASKDFQASKSVLTIAIGKDIAGNCAIADIRRMPHMLIAGATGSGKSVCINSIITSILYKATPEDVRFIMIDPKKVELVNYNGIPHLLIPVVTNLKKAAGALNWAVEEMTNRYDAFNKAGVRDIGSYNDSIEKDSEATKMPHIVIIIDELADLMLTNAQEVEDSIARLAQLARAAGIHLLIATQRPSVNVITGVIKANIPSRLSFAVVSQVDSRTILDMGGAEKLLGNGDMLFYPMGLSKPVRMQGAYVSDKEINKVVEFIKGKAEEPYDQDVVDNIEQRERKTSVSDVESEIDELLPAAIDLVVEVGQASVSYLQRKLRLGYGRAARIMDQMDARGIVGPFEGSKPRTVLISKEEWQELQMNDPDMDFTKV